MAITKVSRGLLSTGISDSSDATAITIDSSENVGIGTSSPDSKLHVDSGVSSTSDWGNLGIISDFPINNTGRIYTSYVLQDSESIKAAGIGLAYDGTGYKMHFGTASTTSSGLSTAVTIDRAGNVGINYTTPSSMSASANNLVVGSGTSGDNTGLTIFSNSDASGSLHFADGTSGAEAYAGYIYYTHSSNIMGFGTGGTEAMRIDSSGIVSIGTTSTGSASGLLVLSTPTNANVGVARFEATGEAETTTTMAVVKSVNSSATSNVFIRFGINGYSGGSGQINANGSSQAAFGTFSDSRLKENITDLPSQLDKIKAMRPVEFDFIESEGGGHQLGFIAQEVEEIYPDLVGERTDGMKTLSGLGKWEARLVKAIQEQQEQIEALQSEINTLKGGD